MHSATLLFVSRAMHGAEALPPAERADLYDVAARLLSYHADLSDHAEACRQAAMHLREAEGAQLQFQHLLTKPKDPRP